MLLFACHQLFELLTQVEEQVEFVGNLLCLRSPTSSRCGIFGSTISTHDLHFWMGTKPRCHGFCRTIRQQIDRSTKLQIDENGAVRLALFPGPVVNAQNAYLRLTRLSQRLSRYDSSSPYAQRMQYLSHGVP